MTWGTLGTRTADLWDKLFREIVFPTQALASGTACATIRYAPPVTVAPIPESDGDQRMLSPFTKLEVTTPDGGYVPADVQAEKLREIGPLLAADLVQSFQFPWGFFVLGQQYLVRLQANQPPATASVEERMVWLVDAAWWLNMMFGATNIYPSWFTTAVALLFDPNWVQGPYVSPERDAELLDIAPFSSLSVDSVVDSYPYRVPFARNPGEFNTGSLLRNAGAFDAVEFLRIKHLVAAQPWVDGIRTYGDASAVTRRAVQEDPSGSANLIRAVLQHTFFKPFLDNKDFFAVIEQIKANPKRLAAFNESYTKVVPAWISVMRSVPYWGFVRAGIDAWQRPAANSLSIVTREGMTEDTARLPMSRSEIKTLKFEWEKARDEARGVAALAAQFQTFVAIISAAAGSYPQAQMGAFNAWAAYAKFRYAVPRAWERAWEIHPVLMRLYPAFNQCDCLSIEAPSGPRPCATELRRCAAGPDVRMFEGGFMHEHVMQNLRRIELVGRVWLVGSRSTRLVDSTALEQQAQPPQGAASPSGGNAEASGVWAPAVIKKPKRIGAGVLFGAGAVVLTGIMFATKAAGTRKR